MTNRENSRAMYYEFSSSDNDRRDVIYVNMNVREGSETGSLMMSNFESQVKTPDSGSDSNRVDSTNSDFEANL